MSKRHPPLAPETVRYNIQVLTPANLETFQAVRSCDRVVWPLHQSLLAEDHLSLVDVTRSDHHPANLLTQISFPTLLHSYSNMLPQACT